MEWSLKFVHASVLGAGETKVLPFLARGLTRTRHLFAQMTCATFTLSLEIEHGFAAALSYCRFVGNASQDFQARKMLCGWNS